MSSSFEAINCAHLIMIHDFLFPRDVIAINSGSNFFLPIHFYFILAKLCLF
jgi:hypothetical protein